MLPAPPNFTSGGLPMPTFMNAMQAQVQNTFNASGPSGTFPSNQQQNFGGITNTMSQDSSSLHQGTDPNSPELFKRNIRNVQEQVIQLQTLARRVLSEIQNAYQTGNSPAHTEANITALKQTLQLVVEMMRQTGVGALPLLPPSTASSPPALPTEQKLLADTTKGLQVLYDKLQRSQESAAVAANLLSLENMAKVTR